MQYLEEKIQSNLKSEDLSSSSHKFRIDTNIEKDISG